MNQGFPEQLQSLHSLDVRGVCDPA
jgi:hypothetical protein